MAWLIIQLCDAQVIIVQCIFTRVVAGFGFKTTFPYHEQMLNDLTCWLQSLKASHVDAIRVACIGNSITDGYGIDMSDSRGYPALMQGELGESYYVKIMELVVERCLIMAIIHMNELAWRDALAFQAKCCHHQTWNQMTLNPQNWKYGSEFRSDMQQMIDSLKSLPSKPKIFLCTPIKAFKQSFGINDSVIVKWNYTYYI